MNEMTLPSRHRNRNSSPGGLRPSTLILGHGGPSVPCQHFQIDRITWFQIYKTAFFLLAILCLFFRAVQKNTTLIIGGVMYCSISY